MLTAVKRPLFRSAFVSVRHYSNALVPLYINGKKIEGNASPFAIVSPWTNEIAHHSHNATIEQALEAAEAAGTTGMQTWAKYSPIQRRDVLFQAAEILKSTKEEHIQAISHEMGAPLGLAEYFFNDSVEYLKEVASRATSCMEGTISVSSKGKVPLIFSEPVGPVLALAPWNAASILSMRAVATPLAAGCPVVFRCSERSPNSHWLTLKCFTEAGLPPGAFNFICNEPETALEVAQALITSKHIRKINFTGSNSVGRQIAIAAAENLKPIVLELGGKSPCIIDAGLSPELANQAAESALFSAWHANGQICMSTERIYVVKEFYSEFVNLLKAKSQERNSNPTIQPSLHFEAEHPNSHPYYASNLAKGFNALVNDALDRGATLVAGQLDPSLFISPTSSENAFIHKTILADVTPEMNLYTEESFGPVACIYPVENIAEAIKLANESDYALSASVWTSDVGTGISIGKALQSGAVHINGSTIHDEATMPHGGVKGSGYGRFGGKWGLSEYIVTKSITLPEVHLK